MGGKGAWKGSVPTVLATVLCVPSALQFYVEYKEMIVWYICHCLSKSLKLTLNDSLIYMPLFWAKVSNLMLNKFIITITMVLFNFALSVYIIIKADKNIVVLGFSLYGKYPYELRVPYQNIISTAGKWKSRKGPNI